MGAVVSLVKVDDSKREIVEAVSKALDLIAFKLNHSVRSVAIKVNLCYYWDAASGYTTDPNFVARIIDHLRERYGGDIKIQIIEADATAMRTKRAFLMLGYKKLAKEKKVDLLNLSDDDVVKKAIHVNGRQLSFMIPQSTLKTDLLINVPKLKTMRITKMSCALKNIFGCIASQHKIAYHPFLNEAIVGINKIIRPHLTMLDGLVVAGRHPVKLGLIMASKDPFSIDWIGAQIIGLDPSKIGFLKVAIKERLGEPKGIAIRGERLETFKELFPQVKGYWLYNVQLGLLKLYRRIVDDVIPPFLQE